MEIVQIDYKAFRKKFGLTQNEIANRLGWSVRQWQKLEYGTTPDPRLSTIVHICRTLEVSADDLLGLSEDENADKAK